LIRIRPIYIMDEEKQDVEETTEGEAVEAPVEEEATEGEAAPEEGEEATE
jgi:hypothetical protein